MCNDLSRQNRGSPISIADILSDQSFADDSTSSPPHSVSKREAICYYVGLPSSPVLVYRTGATPWKRPTGMEAYHVPKELKPVFNHEIINVWGVLGPKVCDCLDSEQVTWTSIDVVRFAEVGKAPGPVVLWIGVMPKSLSGEDAHTAAVGCLQLLESFQLTDVEVEFRESVFARSIGPKLLKSASPFMDESASVRGPLTPALGLRIAAQATPYAEGTGALYISEGPDSEKVYILTARHVVFPPDAGSNELYNRTRTSRPRRREVILTGPKAFQTLLKSIMVKIASHKFTFDLNTEWLQNLQGGARDDKKRKAMQGKLKEAEAAITALNQFHDEATKYWSVESLRVIGHVAYSPPITVGAGAECYTEDWALIELDRNKIDWDNFEGNVVDLGTEISVFDFTTRMWPNPSDTTFKYPLDHLLPLQGVIGEDELRRPQTLDADNEPCLIVIKSGCTTGVTIGRATGVMSFVREYCENGPHRTSMEWAILPRDKSGAFSAPGDSGAVMFDSQGRIGGVLTGGAGQTEDIDVTYGTPFHWLIQRIKERFPDAHLYESTA